MRRTLMVLMTDTAIRDLLGQIRALLTTNVPSSFVPYWSMRTATFAREVETWAVAPPTPERREAVHAALRSLHAQIAHLTNAA